MSKIIVFSDIHFGREDCNLNIASYVPLRTSNRRRAKIDRFFNWLDSDHRNIDECVLLGDIFDLHLASFNQAIAGSYYFLEKLANLPNLRKIIYIPGNHDHTLWLLHLYHSDIIMKLDNTVHPRLPVSDDIDCVNRYFEQSTTRSFLENLFNAGNDIEVVVTYPNHIEGIQGKYYIFFHGHFLSKKQKISKIMFKKFLPLPDRSDLAEFELLCSPQYETLFLVAQCPQGRIGLNDRYKSKLRALLDYGKPIHKLNKEIREYLLNSGLVIGNTRAYYKLDYAIFGHTHLAGIGEFKFRGNPKLIAMNTGSWEDSNNNFGEFIIIDKDGSPNPHPQLYEYKWRRRNPNLHSHNEDLHKGLIPVNKAL